ncbi:CBS domain-containing protein [Bacillus coahuilensis]|nr:CBS domain-containing protein [Bacillus coahuilensis]
MHKTIVFITHDLDEALRIGDRIALMKDGSIVQVGTPEEIMMNPANDYVERFVEDVNLAKVLTAETVMNRAETIPMDRGPRVALKLMKDAGISSVIVVNKKKQFEGVLTAEQVNVAIKQEQTIETYMNRNVPIANKDEVLEDLFEKMASSPFPLPVLDEERRVKGIIKRESVIQALAGFDLEEVKDNE